MSNVNEPGPQRARDSQKQGFDTLCFGQKIEIPVRSSLFGLDYPFGADHGSFKFNEHSDMAAIASP
jgi:hypothetical protein